MALADGLSGGNVLKRRRISTTIREFLPRGNMLDDEVFARRHLMLSWVLALHVPALWGFAVWMGNSAAHAAVEVAIPVACLVLARVVRHRRLAAFFVTAGLVFSSSVLVHLSEGTIEAHFHFFILIGLIALYQDWVPFLWNVIFTVLSHGTGSMMDVNSMYNHYAAQNDPWTWAVIHGAAVLAACAGVIVFWKNTEQEQQRNQSLAVSLAASELAAVQAEGRQRQTVSELLVNLARRNQSLLDRQLELIAELEQRQADPASLGDLFKIDHLATRIRRNAESLVVLAGDPPPRRWRHPVLLTQVVRAAAAEIQDYKRIQILVNEQMEVAGHVVADLAHLLAELIENATTFSPPTTKVTVRTHQVPGEWSKASFVISIEDRGVGIGEAEMQQANDLLALPADVDQLRSRLGFHVVSRLAHRYGMQVRLTGTPGGGVTAWVSLPDALVRERQPILEAPAPPPPPPPPPPAPVAIAAQAARVVPLVDDAVSPGLSVTGRGSDSRQHIGSMLSRYQASRRAGLAVIDTSDIVDSEAAP